MIYLELLAPAKDLECGKAAIDHGADAVYIGAPKFGARSAAGNSVADIRELCDYAHRYSAKVFVTINTLVYDNEITECESLLLELKDAGVDAIIAQDMSVASMVKGMGLHASTQTDNRNRKCFSYGSRVDFTIKNSRKITAFNGRPCSNQKDCYSSRLNTACRTNR